MKIVIVADNAAELIQLAEWFRRGCGPAPELPIATVKIMFGSIEGQMSRGTLRVGQVIMAALVLLDKKGNPRAPESPPEWSLGSDTIASMEVSADGLSAKFTGLDVGVVTGAVKVDARFGPDVVEKVGEFDLEVLPGDIESIDVQFGAPEDPEA